jgi:hypothetical protein
MNPTTLELQGQLSAQDGAVRLFAKRATPQFPRLRGHGCSRPTDQYQVLSISGRLGHTLHGLIKKLVLIGGYDALHMKADYMPESRRAFPSIHPYGHAPCEKIRLLVLGLPRALLRYTLCRSLTFDLVCRLARLAST